MKILIIIAILIICTSFYKFSEQTELFVSKLSSIPIIWSFWHDLNDCPTIVKTNFKRIKRDFTQFKLIILTNDNIHKFIDKNVIDLVQDKIIPHQTDLYRLFILKKYGGLWIDSSVILRNVDFIKNLYTTCVGLDKIALFETQFDNNDTGLPVLENWFILSPKPNNYIINLWYNELIKANKVGFDVYKDLIEKNVQVAHVYIYGDYLTMHACLQYILQTQPEVLKDILVYKSEDSMFYIQEQCGWNANKYRDTFFKFAHTLPCIKLRGGERKIMNNVNVENL